MPLNLEQKKVLVSEMSDVLASTVSVVAADYRGLTVSELTKLRADAVDSGVSVKVFRNTLTRRAIKNTSYECLEPILTGPIVLLLSQNEPGAAARLLRDFLKSHEKLELRGLVLDGVLLGPERLKEVADLPSRDEAISLLMSVMQAPISKLVRTLVEPYAMVARVLARVRDTKQ